MNKVYVDDFGNEAIIFEKDCLPFKGAEKKCKAFVLSCLSMYDDNFEYHRTVHPSFGDALAQLMEFSCGTWKEVKGDNA